MALEIRYDADGCEGMLVRDEETAAPSIRMVVSWTLLGLGAVLASVMATLMLGRTDSIVAVLGAAVVLGIALVQALSAESPLAWEPSYQTVRERFEVRQGVLTLHAEGTAASAELAGAQITAFHDGVWINPALGKPIRLSWDGATRNDVARLTEALTRVACNEARQRGTQRDVPEHLRKLRE